MQPAGADEIELRIDGGRVTLIVTDAPLPAVLAAWARVGHTRVVGAEALADATVTLHLVDVAEAEALRILLRPAIGYVAAPRRAHFPDPRGTIGFRSWGPAGSRRRRGTLRPTAARPRRPAPRLARRCRSRTCSGCSTRSPAGLAAWRPPPPPMSPLPARGGSGRRPRRRFRGW